LGTGGGAGAGGFAIVFPTSPKGGEGFGFGDGTGGTGHTLDGTFGHTIKLCGVAGSRPSFPTPLTAQGFSTLHFTSAGCTLLELRPPTSVPSNPLVNHVNDTWGDANLDEVLFWLEDRIRSRRDCTLVL